MGPSQEQSEVSSVVSCRGFLMSPPYSPEPIDGGARSTLLHTLPEV